METLHQRVAGIDVHRMKHVVTVLIEDDSGQTSKHQREFGGFKRDLKALATWLREQGVELAILESTGIYWKSVYAHLEHDGVPAWVVNAHHVKHVPGRKTDVADSEWLAQLGRVGLVRGSFIPPRDLRELRLVSRYRKKLVALLAAEKNRLHKLLDDAGIKLGGLVADINGKVAQAIVDGLIDGQPASELIMLSGRLRAPKEDILASLDGDLSPRHTMLLRELRSHIGELEACLRRLDAYLIEAMQPYAWAFELLQTIPGIDVMAAAAILIEIGDDMTRYGNAPRLASWAALCPGNNEKAARRARAIPFCVPCSAKPPMQPDVPCRSSKPSIRDSWSDADTKKPLWPWPINSFVPFTSCLPAARRITTRGLITQRRTKQKMLHAG